MRRLAIAACLATGCSDDSIATAFQPLCGDDRPVELLALADDERVASVDGLGPTDELLVVTIATDEDGQPTQSPPQVMQKVVVDRCGEEIVEAAPDLMFMERWGEVLVGCTEDGELVQLRDPSDPAGSSRRLLARHACGPLATSQGHVVVDVDDAAGTARMLSLRTNGTELSVSTLLEGVAMREDGQVMPLAVVIEDRVLVRTSEMQVVSVDATSGDARVEVEAAFEFSASADAIVYRAPGADAEAPTPMVLRDRETKVDEVLDSSVAPSWHGWLGMEPGIVLLTDYGPGGAPDRWFRMNPAREVEAPTGMKIAAVRANGLVWLTRFDAATETLEVFRWHEGESPELAMVCRDCFALGGWSERGLLVLQRTPRLDRRELLRLDDEGGGAARTIGMVGTEFVLLEEDRVLTVLDEGGEKRGALVFYEGVDGEGWEIAGDVEWRSLRWTEWAAGAGEVLFEAWDGGGGHGLYRAGVGVGAGE
jgi:hypothetical protein